MSGQYLQQYLRCKEATAFRDNEESAPVARPRQRIKEATVSHGSNDKGASAQPSGPTEKPSFQRKVEKQAQAIPAMRRAIVKRTVRQRKGAVKSRAVLGAVENNQTRQRWQPRQPCQSQPHQEHPAGPVPRATQRYRHKPGNNDQIDTGVLLSTVLDRTPVLEQCSATTHVFPAKIAAVDKCISGIGKLRASHCAAYTAFLSHNCLHSLHGLSQLARVHTLSLADNLIEDVNELRELRALTQLRALTLSGNPVSFMPHYRAHVLANIDPAALGRMSADGTTPEDSAAQLFKLDGVAVCAFEAGSAAELSQRDHSMRRLFVSNDCVMHQLHTCLMLLQLHVELRATVHHRVIQPLPLSFSVGRFIELWPYEKGVEANDREQRYILRRAHDATRTFFSALWNNAANSTSLKANANILDEQASLMRRAKHVSDTWDSACAEFVATQQSAIAHLHGRCEEIVAHSDSATRRRGRPRQHLPLGAPGSGKRHQPKYRARARSPWAVAGPRWRNPDDKNGGGGGGGVGRGGSGGGDSGTRSAGNDGRDDGSSHAREGDHTGRRRNAGQMKSGQEGHNRQSGIKRKGQRPTSSTNGGRYAGLSKVIASRQHDARAIDVSDGKREDVAARYQKALDCVGEAKPHKSCNPKQEEEELLREKAQLLKALQQCDAVTSIQSHKVGKRRVQWSEAELEQRHEFTPDQASKSSNVGHKLFSPSKLPPQLHAPDSPIAAVPHSSTKSNSNVEDIKQRVRSAVREIYGCEISETLLLRLSERPPRNITELFSLLQSAMPEQLDITELQQLMEAKAHTSSLADTADDDFDTVRRFVHVCLSPPIGWDSDRRGITPKRMHSHPHKRSRRQRQSSKIQHGHALTQARTDPDRSQNTHQDDAEKDQTELAWHTDDLARGMHNKQKTSVVANCSDSPADKRMTEEEIHVRRPTESASIETKAEMDEIETRLFADPKASRVFVRMGFHKREQWRAAVVDCSAKCVASRNIESAIHALCKWKGYIARGKFATRARGSRHRELLRRGLDSWRRYARFSYCVCRWMRSHALVAVSTKFHIWRSAIHAMHQESQACASADCLRQRLFLRRLFRAWRSHTHAATLTPAREYELLAWALAHDEWRLKARVLRRLSRYLDKVVRPRRKAIAVLSLRAEMRTTSRALCRVVLQRWRKVVTNTVQRRCEAKRDGKLQSEAYLRIKHTVVRSLTAYFSRHVRARLRHALNAWKDCILAQLHLDEAGTTSKRIADGMYRRKRQRQVWSLWTTMVHSRRTSRDNEARALEHFFTTTFRRNFDLWRRHYRASAMDRWRGHRVALIAAVQHWQCARQNARAREAREHVATVMASRRIATRVRAVIVEWHAYVVESRLRRVALQAAARTASVGTLRAAIGIWRRCTFYLVRYDADVMAAMQAEQNKKLRLQTESARSLVHECESLTADGLQLRDKVHAAEMALSEARMELESTNEANRRLQSRALHAEEALQALEVEHHSAERRWVQEHAASKSEADALRRDVERMSAQLNKSQGSEQATRARLEAELGREKATVSDALEDAAQAHRDADAAARAATLLQEEYKIETENAAREFHSAIAREQQRAQLAENACAASQDALEGSQAEFEERLHEWRERALRAERDAQRMEASMAETSAAKVTLETERSQQQSWGREISAMLAEKDAQLAAVRAQMRQQLAAARGFADNTNAPLTPSAADARAVDLLQRLRSESNNETTLPVATAHLTQPQPRTMHTTESKLDCLEKQLASRLGSQVPASIEAILHT